LPSAFVNASAATRNSVWHQCDQKRFRKTVHYDYL
jgi:hypothetical protein